MDYLNIGSGCGNPKSVILKATAGRETFYIKSRTLGFILFLKDQRSRLLNLWLHLYQLYLNMASVTGREKIPFLDQKNERDLFTSWPASHLTL